MRSKKREANWSLSRKRGVEVLLRTMTFIGGREVVFIVNDLRGKVQEAFVG